MMRLLCSFALILFISSEISADSRSHRVRRIVGGEPAQLPPADDPKVFLRFAGKAAEIRGVLEYPHYVFRGLRFGLKPSGKDRFQRPRQYFQEGEIDATKYPPPCLQTIPGETKVIGDEDCLFLNVFTPDLPDGTEGLPVVIWIHGGGFRHGSASQYGVRNLVGQQLVIVTIQYRLGTLGFLSTGTPELPGNAALWDMALAVQWVRNYIGYFGGNPHRIVVMGQGSGASSALMVALSNIAKGTISAVVAMSGTAISNWAVENAPILTARDIAEYHGCPTTSAMILLKCLQSINAADIAEGDTALEKVRLTNRGFVTGLNGMLGAAPNAEGRFDGRSLPAAIEQPPMVDMMQGNIPNIPILTGITRDETKRAVEKQYKNEIFDKLKIIPNFLDQVLIKNLQNCTRIEKPQNAAEKNSTKNPNLFDLLNPLQFRNYLKIAKNNFIQGLSKIAEATTDALFNLPAFLTAELWFRKGVESYLYRFEHVSRNKKGFGHFFLKGLPIIGNDTTELNNSVCHGDDLAFIFEPQNLDGSPMEKQIELSEDDKKTRDEFTRIIAEFAKTGKITIDNKQVDKFSGSNFIQVSKKSKTNQHFRFCEMALWAGLAERLKQPICQFLNALDTTVKSVENLFFDTVAPARKNLDKSIADAQKAIDETVAKINPFNQIFKKQTTAKPQNIPKV